MSQNFLDPRQGSEEPGKRVYRFVHKKTEDPNDPELEEFFIPEADLTRDDLNLLFQELVRTFEFMPAKVQEGMVAYIDRRIAIEKNRLEIGNSLQQVEELKNSPLILPPGMKN